MIKILCVGKLKEKYWKDACEEYLKRLTKYVQVELVEVMDEKIDDEKIALQKEKERLEKRLNLKDYIIALEIEGEELSSTELSKTIETMRVENFNLTFIIGGSYGIHPDIKEHVNKHISFSKLTFPHQLFRVLLLEQLYRSFKIQNNEKYHK